MNKKILKAIERNELVVVIGNDISLIRLLKNDISNSDKLIAEMDSAKEDGEFITININEYLAFYLWNDEKEDQTPPCPYTLNNVVEVLVNERITNQEKIKKEINYFIKDLTDEQIVLDPFKKLAKLSNIDTILSVNFDNFLERAFEAEGKHVNPSINFAIQNSDDSEDLNRKDKALTSIFNLMGNIKGSDFALTEEMHLEFLYTLLMGKDAKTKALFNSVKNKSILFIGCSFPNWFMRFFIRTISKQRFKEDGNSRFVASDKTTQDIDLSTFLESYDTSVISIGKPVNNLKKDAIVYANTIDFIDKLYKKTEKNTAIITNTKPRFKEKLFLSYRRLDESIVEKLKNEFEKCGVELFYDNDELRNGDNFEKTIYKYIYKCDYFLPIISKNSLESKENFVYKDEWIPAINIEKGKVLDDRFNKEGQETYIRPYIIDQTSPTDDRIPTDIRKRNITEIPSIDSFPEIVRKFIKENNLTGIDK